MGMARNLDPHGPKFEDWVKSRIDTQINELELETNLDGPTMLAQEELAQYIHEDWL